MPSNNSSQELILNAERVLILLRRWWLPLVASIVVGAIAGWLISDALPIRYTTTASIEFNQNPVVGQLLGTTASSSNDTTLVGTNVELLQLAADGADARATALKVGHGLTEQDVASALSVSGVSDTSVVSIAATDTDPKIAAAIANEFAKTFIASQEAQDAAAVKAAQSAISAQLNGLSRAESNSAEAQSLQSRAQELELLSQLASESIQVASAAPVPKSSSSPDKPADILLGAVLGLVLACAFVLLRERLDRRVKDPRDLESMFNVPVLSIVPEDPLLAEGLTDRAALTGPIGEVFQLLRAHLRYFNVDRNLRVLIVVSASPVEGKSTIAYQLAAAAARMGDRTLLVDADLRRPTLGRRLGLTNNIGVSDVLPGTVSLEEAIVHLETGDTSSGVLDVMGGGTSIPPNPGELIESRAMEDLVGQLRASYELVVIDTPPLTIVSDAIPLLGRADGVIAVCRLGKVTKDEVERLSETLAGVKAPLLGVVANYANRNTTPGFSYGYEYGTRDPDTPTASESRGLSARRTPAE